MSTAKCKQEEEVRGPDIFSGNDAVVGILEKMSSNRAEPCDGGVPTGRRTNLQSINQCPSALKTVEDDGSEQIELFLCQELEEKGNVPDILGCSGAGGSEAVVLEKVSTANRAESGTPCSGGNDAVVDILEKQPSRANRAESCSEEVPTEKGANLRPINQRRSAEQTVEDDGSKQGESFADQTMRGSFQFKGYNRFNGKKPVEEKDFIAFVEQRAETNLDPASAGLDNERAPGSSCEMKPVASHCTCLHKKHEASSSDSSRIEHHMSPIPEGFTRKQDKAGRVESWAILRFSDISANHTIRFKYEVRNACAEIQLDIKEMPLTTMHLGCALPDGIEDSLWGAYKFINTGIPRGKQLGLLIIVLPYVRDFDEKVETICKHLGVVYHCCFPEDVIELSKQYLNNIAHAIKAKVLERNSCCDYCKNIGLGGSSIEFFALDEESDDYVSSSDEDILSDTDSDEVYGFDNKMEGDDGSEQSDELREIDTYYKEPREFEAFELPNVSHEHMTEADGLKHNIQPPFEDFLCPDKRDHLLKLGWGSQLPYMKPYNIPSGEYSKLFDENGNYKLSNKHNKDMNLASAVEGAVVDHKAEVAFNIPDTLAVNVNSAEYNTLEESGEPQLENCSESNDLDLVEVEQETTIHWACISYSIMDQRQLLRFFTRLRAVFMANGMYLNSMPIKMELVDSAITAESLSQTWSDLCKSASELLTSVGIKGAQIEFVLVILPECRDFDEEVEKVFKNLGVVYQLCLPLTIRIPTNGHLKKFARQIKFKVSKHGMVTPFVSEAPTILFGADISHCAPEEGSRSVASVVASLDWPKVSKYEARVASQPHHEVIIRNLFNRYGGMVSKLLLSFYSTTKKIPQRMIFFRHGIIEGQESHICQQEIDAIKQDCAFLGKVPTLTYVVTQSLNMEFKGKKRLKSSTRYLLPC